MKKLIITFKAILVFAISTILVSVQAMLNLNTAIRNKSEQAERYNQHNALVSLQKNAFNKILLHCHTHDYDPAQALEKSIKTFIALSTISKHFNALLTCETIGELCKNYSRTNKKKVLKKIMKNMHISNYNAKRFPALILICAGADPNTVVNGSSLLYKAVTHEDEQLLTTLFKYNANSNEACEVCPTFFYAETVEIAQIFINNEVNVHTTESHNKTNVLWDVLDNEYPIELIKFYLEQNVDATAIRPFDNACLLHELAWSNYYVHLSSPDNFLKKAILLLDTIPYMINTLNKNGSTPIDLAYKSQQERLYSDAFKELIILFRKCGGKTAQELKEESSIK